MRRLPVTTVLAAGLTTLCALVLTAPSAAAARSGGWGKAEEVPGTAALNVDGDAQVTAVSCASARNCAAGGTYRDGAGDYQLFVATQRRGRWTTAKEIPGLGHLNVDGNAQFLSVSCASAGNCSAGGSYSDKSGDFQAFVVTERGGVWGAAQEVPGTARLNVDGYAVVTSVSCPSPGDCTAAGYYRDDANHTQAFIAVEVRGRWHKAEALPGLAHLNTGGDAVAESVACPARGYCVAGGDYTDSADHNEAFLATEQHGSWGKALEVRGTAHLNKGGTAVVVSAACASPGNCAAGGYYASGTNRYQAFVVTQRKGSWGKALEVPGTGQLNEGGNAQVSAISCASPGDCGAAGYFEDSALSFQPYVVLERNGRWAKAGEVRGIASVPGEQGGQTYSISCPAAGDCVAGGYYETSTSGEAFIVQARRGHWAIQQPVPGLASLNKGAAASLNAVWCSAVAQCLAGGAYRDGSGDLQAFVVSQR